MNILLPIASLLIGQCNLHGVPALAHPNWQERSMQTMVNVCRMDPIGYRDTYLPGAGNILESYAPVPPLEWAFGLNQSAYTHSIDMAFNCGLQHNSCDGTPWPDRIGSYWPDWHLLGENIAGGFTDPVTCIGGLVSDPHEGAPAPDHSGYDGHRWNIMYEGYTNLGCGYFSLTGSQFVRYYTQDFGLPNTPVPPCSYIPSGSHIFIGPDIIFLCNWDGPPAQLPLVVIDEQPHTMFPHLDGTFRYSQPVGTTCHLYHFEIDGVRYPTLGEFATYGEGGCTTNYEPSADFNADGQITVGDIFDFLNGWLASNPYADFNQSGTLSVADIFAFLNAWFNT